MPYKFYSLNEFKDFINEIIRCKTDFDNISNDGYDDYSVYEKLFNGLDMKMLGLSCTHIKWSIAKQSMSSFRKIIEKYADSIVEIVPYWKKHTDYITTKTSELAADFKKIYICYINNDEESIKYIYSELIKKLKIFQDDSKSLISIIDKKQIELINFIGATLLPASKEVTKWKEYGIEQCLYNDRFINGTEVSIRNAGTLFSFIDGNIIRCIEIISNLSLQSSEEIMFVIDGQSKIWDVMVKVSQQLYEHTLDFLYKAPFNNI